MLPPKTGRKGFAQRTDLRNPINSTQEITVPTYSSQRGNIPKASPLKPHPPNQLAGPSKLLSTLPWPPGPPKQSHLPKPSTKTTLQGQHWLAPRTPMRILQRPTISRPTPLVVEGIDGAEAFVNPRAAPAVPNHLLQNIQRAPVRILQRPPITRPTVLVVEEFVKPRAVPAVPTPPMVSPLGAHVDAGARVDPRPQAEAQGSDSASTTLSQIIRAAGITHLDLSTTVTDTEKSKRSGLRRWKFNPPSRLPRARSDKKALSVRIEAFKRFKAQMDQEKEEYDLKLWREGGWERKRDLRIVRWLEGIPGEAEREFEEGGL